jgi:anti-sigma regulatory factor (Ser/Thr protein kinase)
MQLELTITNDPCCLPVVRNFLQETLSQLPLDRAAAGGLTEFVTSIVQDAVEHAYPVNVEGKITLSVEATNSRLEVAVRDFGLPQDIERLERQLHDGSPAASPSLAHPGPELADEVHWLAFGPNGKALRVVKWLSTEHIADMQNRARQNLAQTQPPLAPPQQYSFRRMHPEEAIQVSQLMYETYGSTYFNEDVYYPDRVASLNARNSVLSFVALTEDGKVAGHYALELDEEGLVAEGGQAAVDPAHRGRGLLDAMKAIAFKEAERLNLIGWYADAVTVHTLTQKSDVTHGGHLTAVDLGIAPKSESFHDIAEKLSQRVTCLMYFSWLRPPAERTVYVPRRHQQVVAEIYEGLGCRIQFGEPDSALDPAKIAVKIDTGAASAVIRVTKFGADAVRLIAHAKRQLVERSHAEVVFVDLPLAVSATMAAAEELEREGFAFAGILPNFSQQGDMLRVAYLVEPLAREPIKTFDDFAARLVDYCLAEQARVQSAL